MKVFVLEDPRGPISSPCPCPRTRKNMSIEQPVIYGTIQYNTIQYDFNNKLTNRSLTII